MFFHQDQTPSGIANSALNDALNRANDVTKVGNSYARRSSLISISETMEIYQAGRALLSLVHCLNKTFVCWQCLCCAVWIKANDCEKKMREANCKHLYAAFWAFNSIISTFKAPNASFL